MPSRSIEQWYEWVINLDRYWRESKREEERLRSRREMGHLVSRVGMLANTGRAQRQQLS